ncbi:hypothetical protein BJ508DRAFT_314037 [Ascobolus immersus RN42]|uniref:Uncharacterized protein n=1 Tax=Ascobolus immersus RN42 TaxID=1160509 RepID=A0A3N4HIK2_ASCIM|nr:hypothetical protein BJ508DRAFT_314037 [Ascobolus immersus RN42]
MNILLTTLILGLTLIPNALACKNCGVDIHIWLKDNSCKGRADLLLPKPGPNVCWTSPKDFRKFRSMKAFVISDKGWNLDPFTLHAYETLGTCSAKSKQNVSVQGPNKCLTMDKIGVKAFSGFKWVPKPKKCDVKKGQFEDEVEESTDAFDVDAAEEVDCKTEVGKVVVLLPKWGAYMASTGPVRVILAEFWTNARIRKSKWV